MSLSPKRCLQNMADDLSNMEDAQRRFVEADKDYTNGMAGSGDRRAMAMTDTAYYAQQAQTWALAAQALMAGLERYGNKPDADRDFHAEVKDADQCDGFRVGGRW